MKSQRVKSATNKSLLSQDVRFEVLRDTTSELLGNELHLPTMPRHSSIWHSCMGAIRMHALQMIVHACMVVQVRSKGVDMCACVLSAMFTTLSIHRPRSLLDRGCQARVRYSKA